MATPGQHPGPAAPWLLGVARNLLSKHAGAGRRRRQLTERIAALTGTADLAAWDAEHHVVERETALAVFVSLPDRDVETLTLVTWHGLNIADAATVVGCSPRAFTVRLHRARRRLTDVLRDVGESTVRPPVTSLQGK